MQNIINAIRRQFLCGVPLNEINFHSNIQDLSLDDQKLLLDRTVNDENVIKYPIKIEYQKSFVRYLIQRLEKGFCEIYEDIYSTYGRLVSLNSTQSDYFKHYVVEATGRIIILKETIYLVSEGTTGLRTWPASLALSEWILKNNHYLEEKTILELGSGIGLTGLFATLECSPKKFYFSDCHGSVLKTLCENIILNTSDQCNGKQLVNHTTLNLNLNSGNTLSVLNLPWQDVDFEVSKKLGNIDVILAADVVYDIELFDPLIQALKTISQWCGTKDIIFACTERNTETLEQFLKLIGEHFSITEEDCPTQDNFIWSNSPRVRFFRFILIQTTVIETHQPVNAIPNIWS